MESLFSSTGPENANTLEKQVIRVIGERMTPITKNLLQAFRPHVG